MLLSLNRASEKSLPGRKVAPSRITCSSDAWANPVPPKVAPEKFTPFTTAVWNPLTSMKVVPVTPASWRLLPSILAPVNVAPVRFAPAKTAPRRSTPLSVAPSRTAFPKWTPCNDPPCRVVLGQKAPLRSSRGGVEDRRMVACVRLRRGNAAGLIRETSTFVFEKLDRHDEISALKSAADSSVCVRSTSPPSVPEKSLQVIVASLRIVPDLSLIHISEPTRLLSI